MADIVVTVEALEAPASGIAAGIPERLTLPEGTTVRKMLRIIADDGDYEELLERNVVVNQTVVRTNTVLKDGDHVVIVAPVFGG